MSPERGEVVIYYHDLGPGATYAGDLPMVSAIEGGGTFFVPADSQPGDTYTIRWNGVCGSHAEATAVVSWYENGICTAPSSGAMPVPSAVRVEGNHLSYMCFGDPFDRYVFSTWSCSQPAETWRTSYDVSGYWYLWTYETQPWGTEGIQATWCRTYRSKLRGI